MGKFFYSADNDFLFLTDKTFCVPQQESHTGFGNTNDDRISFFV